MPTKIDGIDYWSKAEICSMLGGMEKTKLNSRMTAIGMQCVMKHRGRMNLYSAEQVEVLQRFHQHIAATGSMSGFAYGGYSVSDARSATPSASHSSGAIQVAEDNSAIIDDSHIESRASQYPGGDSGRDVPKGQRSAYREDLVGELEEQLRQDKERVLKSGCTRAARLAVGQEAVMQYCLRTGDYGDPELTEAVRAAKQQTQDLVDEICSQSPNDFAQSILQGLKGLG